MGNKLSSIYTYIYIQDLDQIIITLPVVICYRTYPKQSVYLIKTLCYVDNTVIPNSWKTVNSSTCNLHCRKVIIGPTSGYVATDKRITTEQTNYNAQSLRDNLSNKLTTAVGSIFSAITYNQIRSRSEISLTTSTYQFEIWADNGLINENGEWKGETYDKANLNSASELLSIYELRNGNTINSCYSEFNEI